MKKKREVLISLGWYDPRFFNGIGRFARKADWHLATRPAFEGAAPGKWNGDGMLINGSATRSRDRGARAQAMKQPTVLFGTRDEAIQAPSVDEDNSACGRLAAEHFLERGHRHFAWFGLRRGRVERERRDSFVKTLQAAGQPCTLLEWDKARGRTRDTWANCRRWLITRLKQLPKPMALFVLDDLLAADAIEVCMEQGLRVPEDVAILGVGNIELACECSRVPISSIDLDMETIAYRAAQQLERLMSGSTVPQRTIVPVRGIVARASTHALAITDPTLAKALEFFSSSLHRNIGVEDAAAAAGISKRRFHQLFAQQLRITPAKYLLKMRLAKAKQLLEQSQLKVREIASKTGFGTLRNIHRCFVRELQMPPLEYRRKATAGSSGDRCSLGSRKVFLRVY